MSCSIRRHGYRVDPRAFIKVESWGIAEFGGLVDAESSDGNARGVDGVEESFTAVTPRNNLIPSNQSTLVRFPSPYFLSASSERDLPHPRLILDVALA